VKNQKTTQLPSYCKLQKRLRGQNSLNRKCFFVILFLVVIFPVFWYVPGHVIGKGDCYPFSLSIGNFNSDLNTWSSSNLGNPSPSPSYAVLGLFWSALKITGVDIGFLQIAYLMLCFGVAMASIFYLTRLIYPETALAAIIAGVFYVFNFFLFSIILNIGLIWTYAWLPLLMALLVKVLTQKNRSNRNCIIFAFVFSIVASVSSVNLANVVLIIFSLGAIFIYYTVFDRRMLAKQLIKTAALLLALTALLSAWWVIPNINYYMPSSSFELQKDVNVQSWDWTHQRASLLNLFSLNAGWSWRAEYTPYYQAYSENVILLVLMLVPFLFACSALMFKKKRLLNSYFLFFVLIFLFLAKGLHEPLSFVNLFFYNSIPYMDAFREPVSKFILITLPFLALLIGYAVSKITMALSSRFTNRRVFYRSLFMVFLVAVLVSPVLPLLANPLETKTTQIPYSSYVRIPQYWFQANQWLNNQTGDFRVLLTAPDDYYQMPYVWGYYGTDSLIERLIEKPVVSATCVYSYKTNPNTVALISHLSQIIENNRTNEFKSFLNILNVKYIIQRNDIDYKYLESVGRRVPSIDKMKNFLSNQTYLTLVKKFDALDIYEYHSQSNQIRTLPPQFRDDYNFEIVERNASSFSWNFDSLEQLDNWKNVTLQEQFDSKCELSLDNGTLRFEILNSTWGWKILSSPLIEVNNEAKYDFLFETKGQSAYEPHVKIFEFNDRMELIAAKQFSLPIDKSSGWINFQSGDFKVLENTKFIQLQIWSGHATTTPLPNKIWLDNFEVKCSVEKLNSKVQQVVEAWNLSGNAEILEYERVSPTEIVAKVNASEPFTLIISEAYDQNWEATVDEKTISAIPVFSLNGFNIAQTGLSTIIIEYKPQKWFYYSLAVSAITSIVCIGYLLFAKYKHQLQEP
jgi:hypothetical protein